MENKQRKKQIRKYIRWVCLALVVLLLAVMPLLASQSAEEDGPQASILTATAERKDITTQLIGGGQLSSDATEDITIPAQIKLTKYLVDNGDNVKKGDPIARVDKVSVMTALQEVQETLDYLSKELADVSNDTEPDEIKARSGGLVKIVYGEAGDDVRDVMLEHGALAVLSLDGRMALDIQRETELTVGDTVTVTLSDDTGVDGRVESAVSGVLTVSIEDDDYAIGDTAVVTDDDGNRLGSGELYIHSPWNATAYHGTITTVKAQENTWISAGRTLFQLETSGHSAQFQILNEQRKEYEELMRELFAMYDSGVITAPCDGFVTGVDEDATFLLAADSAEQTWFVQPLSNVVSNETPGWTVMLLSNETPDAPDDPDTPDNPDSPDNPDDPDDPDDPDNPGNPDAPDAPDPAVTYTVTVGQVQADGTVQLGFTYANITDLNSVPTTVTPNGSTATWPTTGLLNRDLTPYSGTATAGNILFQVTSSNGDTFYVFAAVAAPSQQPQVDISGMMGAMGSMMGGMTGGMGTTQTFEVYSLEEVTIATVTSQEKMSLEITVDEQDISRLHLGQEATILVEALTGQTFPATITSISNTGTNEGGSSKFSATLTLSQSGEMLPSMNASAYLDLDTAESVLTVPVAALVEEGTEVFVYTSYAEKDDLPGNPVPVTTGVSDGEYVQILSGLQEGTTVYYPYYDTVEESNIPDRGFGF